MLLILSARSVGDDIALQFGRLPPAFLPLGNRRLFAHQAELAQGEPMAMTVPRDFAISAHDRQEIDRLGIRLIPQDPRLSLPAAIRDALEQLAIESPVRILYGDTLVRLEAPPRGDMVALQHSSANYLWAYVDGTGFSDAPPQRLDRRQIVCGYFVFEDPAALIRACSAGGIVDVLNAYDAERPLARHEVAEWHDFGHLPLYFQSRKLIMIKRVFNEISFEEHLLVKQSQDTAKMRAEAHWFEQLPAALRLHVPRFGGRVERNHMAGYALEYLYTPVLSDLAAFGTLPLASWLEILAASFEFLDKCQAIRPPPGSPEASPAFAQRFAAEILAAKTWRRLETYAAASGLSLDTCFRVNGRAFPPLRDVVAATIAAVPPTTPEHMRFWHGDTFFGNMFYDFTARRVMVVDPRGQLAPGELCLYGDWRYDLAKLAHSVIGQYDRIILGCSRLTENGPGDWDLDFAENGHQAQIAEIFLDRAVERYGVGRDELLALTALLFFSMLPLHSDRPDLQRQMLANGLRLAGMMTTMGQGGQT